MFRNICKYGTLHGFYVYEYLFLFNGEGLKLIEVIYSRLWQGNIYQIGNLRENNRSNKS